MDKLCQTCRYWQGNRLKDEGDCYRVIATIEPILDIKNRYGFNTSIPFDPHDVRYYFSSSKMKATLKNLKNSKYKVEYVKTKMKMLNDRDEETIKIVKLPYIITHKTENCDLYELK